MFYTLHTLKIIQPIFMKKNIKRKQVKGFTLVELLAVIVILAIILVIAVPKIMDTIKDATKASLESSAKMVASQVENQYTVAQTLGKEFEDTGSCMEEWAGLNGNDYASCRYEITSSGEAKVTLVGKGKFNGLSVCNATRSIATAIEGECSACPEEEITLKIANPTKPYAVENYESCVSYLSNELPNYGVAQTMIEETIPTLCEGKPVFEMSFSQNIEQFIGMGFEERELIENDVIKGSIEEEMVCVPNYGKAVTYINNLYNDTNVRNKFGLIKDNTADQNIRYVGANNVVKNYVEFGNARELWRIIGVFEMETSNGKTEELVKIVRDESFKDSEGTLWMSWDSSASNINNGLGINEWSQADLKTMLNTYYIGESTSCTYCNGSKQATCTNSCNNSITPINSTYRNMIESVVWNIGAIEWNDNGITPLQAYNAERGNVTGKICSQGSYGCDDTVTRTTKWEGKIGLMYPSDWGYASTNENCTDITFISCNQSNWSNNGSWYLTISPGTESGRANFVWSVAALVADDTYTGSFDSYLGRAGRPALYLKSNVQIIDGDGSENNPYKLSI